MEVGDWGETEVPQQHPRLSRGEIVVTSELRGKTRG